MKKTMPDEIRIDEKNGCTLEMYNDRGSERLCDIYIDKSDAFIQLDLNAVNGSMDIRYIKPDLVIKLSAYQVQVLIQFLSQKD